MKTTQENFLSDKIKKMDQFILVMPENTWFSTRGDTELIDIVKQWIDGDYLWPKYYLEFNSDFTKFKKGTNEYDFK
jgi:hypothetical protein